MDSVGRALEPENNRQRRVNAARLFETPGTLTENRSRRFAQLARVRTTSIALGAACVLGPVDGGRGYRPEQIRIRRFSWGPSPNLGTRTLAHTSKFGQTQENSQ